MEVTRVQVDRSEEEDVVTLDIEVGQSEVQRAQGEVYRQLAREANIPGFRRGKVPPMILKQRFGTEAIQQLVADRLVPDAYRHALKQTDVQPVDEAKVDVVECEENKPLHFKATVAVRPELELGNYKGIPAERRVRGVPDREVDEILEGMRKRAAEWVDAPDHPAEHGDRVIGKLTARVEGKIPEDGREREVNAILGRNQIQPPIDSELEGIRAGETRTFPVKYPDDFDEESLAGKAAEFEVAIESVQVEQLPALDDELPQRIRDQRKKALEEFRRYLTEQRGEDAGAALATGESDTPQEPGDSDEQTDGDESEPPDQGSESGETKEGSSSEPQDVLDGVSTLADLRGRLRKRLEERNRLIANEEVEEEVVAIAVGRVNVPVPQPMLERELDSQIESLQRRVTARGIDFDDYLTMTGQKSGDLREQLKPEAERHLRQLMVLDAIATAENLTATQAEIDQRVAQMAEALRVDPAEFRKHLEEGDTLEGVERSILRQEATELLVANAEIEETLLPAEVSDDGAAGLVAEEPSAAEPEGADAETEDSPAGEPAADEDQ
jgi:trigger factor